MLLGDRASSHRAGPERQFPAEIGPDSAGNQGFCERTWSQLPPSTGAQLRRMKQYPTDYFVSGSFTFLQ